MKKWMTWAVKDAKIRLRISFFLLPLALFFLFCGVGPAGVWIVLIVNELRVIFTERYIIKKCTDFMAKEREEQKQGQGDGSAVSTEDE